MIPFLLYRTRLFLGWLLGSRLLLRGGGLLGLTGDRHDSKDFQPFPWVFGLMNLRPRHCSRNGEEEPLRDDGVLSVYSIFLGSYPSCKPTHSYQGLFFSPELFPLHLSDNDPGRGVGSCPLFNTGS